MDILCEKRLSNIFNSVNFYVIFMIEPFSYPIIFHIFTFRTILIVPV
jgi:hypothetical protein